MAASTTNGGKNVLIVYAHQDCHSFNCALKDAAVGALEAGGFNVKVSDLYAMHFKATTTKDDIRGSFKKEVFNYADEILAACTEGRLSEDVIIEMDKVRWADLMIYQFPMYMLGLPSILKGWFDRVFLNGFAFTLPDQTHDRGLFAGKRAIISCTTGAPRNFFQPDGPYGDIDVCLWPIEVGGLHFTGLSVLKANICAAVKFVTAEERTKMLLAWKKRVLGLFDEEPKKFFKLSDFEPYGVGRLKKESLERAVREGSVPAGHIKATLE